MIDFTRIEDHFGYSIRNWATSVQVGSSLSVVPSDADEAAAPGSSIRD
jgi:hypothetical protein